MSAEERHTCTWMDCEIAYVIAPAQNPTGQHESDERLPRRAIRIRITTPSGDDITEIVNYLGGGDEIADAIRSDLDEPSLEVWE